MSADVDVAVIGAGIAGLTAAHDLHKSGCSVRVFEASDHVGGRMATKRVDGYRVDTGAEQISVRGYESTWAVLAELGIDRSSVPRIGRHVAMWRDGRAHVGVAHPRGMITGAGLSARARLDLLRAVRGKFDLDQPEHSRLGAGTVAEFAASYHPDLLDYLCQPVVSGFFGWHPAKSAAAPFLSLLTSIGPSSGWRTYRDGMDTMARALAHRLDVVTSCPVHEVVAGPRSARVVCDTKDTVARAVVFAIPAPEVLQVYQRPSEHDRPFLTACSYASMVKVHLLLNRRPEPREYTLLVPSVENPTVSTIMYDHRKHPNRAPEGCGLVTLIANPDITADLLEVSDDEVTDRLTEAAEEIVPGLRAATRRSIVHRFRYGLPEATPRALALRADFAVRMGGVVDYAGDWVTLSPCSESAVRSGRRAAARVLSTLGGERL
jgi:oxygen-dependent protoporphyrinogen oxidase